MTSRPSIAARLRTSLAEWGWGGTTRRAADYLARRAARACARVGERALAPRRREALASRSRLELLAPNRALRDSARGRRCFVLASGPSTLEQDLSRLRGEAVIAVNEMFLRLRRDAVAPAVLIFQDPAYLRDTESYRRFVADFAAAAADSGATAIVPAAAAPEVVARGLFPSRPPYYFALAGRMLDDPPGAARTPIDFAAPLPDLPTVSHTALALALHMGFAEIVLLGIDLDYLREPEAPIRHGYGRNPYNDQDAASAQEVFRRGQNWDLPALLERSAEELRAYERLGEIAARAGRRVFNSSPRSLLTMFERRPFDSWFEGS